jgi:hypothetical protein
MFYTHEFQTDPNDNSVTKTLWYTDQGYYKECYNKAQDMYNTMTDPSGPCHLMKKDSQNYKDCTTDQNNLYIALGCDNSMFQTTTKDGEEYYTIKPNAAQDCQDRLNAVGQVRIVVIGQDGKPTAGEPTSSSSVLAKTSGGGGSAAGSDQSDASLGCDGSANPLSWIICPVVNDLLVPAIDATDQLITNELSIKSESIFCTGNSSSNDPCEAYYTAWVSFRNIALGLLVVAGLIIVIAQAVGMEILDAYTVRKMLPRLLVAAVGITLSWTLMNFAVTLSNDLGFGVRDLITAPFHNFDSSINLNFANGGGFVGGLENFIGGTGGLALGLAAGASLWIATGGLGIILSYVLTAGLAVLVAVLVLVLRQIAVIMLILVAPIALIAYVLPNTQRVFRFWWESFIRALLMFPMIAAMIAAGRVFAAISLTSADNGAGGVLRGLIGFVAYFAPYFMIPMTFRFSGGVMSGFGNFVQQRAQGAFSGLGGWRSNIRKDRISRARSGGLYRGSNKLARMMNTVGDYTLDVDENLPYDFGTGNRAGVITRGKYNPLGYAGRAVFGRQGRDLAEQIGGQAVEQTEKGRQKANMHYSAAWAALGMLDDGHGGQGLTAEGRRLIDQEYGTEFAVDPHTGERRATAWRAPRNADFGDIDRLGTILEEHGTDGSHSRMAGQQLRAKAGTLSSFGLDPETKRATVESVAAAQAARDGKLGADDLSRIYNHTMEGTRPGSVERAVAVRELEHLEDSATQQRHDLRRAKGIRIDSDGHAYSVYSHKMVRDSDGVEKEAFKTAKAKESLMTAKANPAGMGKGEFWDDTKDTWLHHASERDAEGNLTEDAIELRKFLVQSTGIWGTGDPGAKTKANAIKEQLGIDAAEEASYQRGYDPNDVGSHAAEGMPDPPDDVHGAPV